MCVCVCSCVFIYVCMSEYIAFFFKIYIHI